VVEVVEEVVEEGLNQHQVALVVAAAAVLAAAVRVLLLVVTVVVTVTRTRLVGEVKAVTEEEVVVVLESTTTIISKNCQFKAKAAKAKEGLVGKRIRRVRVRKTLLFPKRS
jgi:hypothetical protein